MAEFDAFKHSALPVVADARAALGELTAALESYRIAGQYAVAIGNHRKFWQAESDRIFALRHGPPISQGEVIGAVNVASRPQDVVVCAAGSLPGDLHKLWRTRQPRGYHVEYGYSCMGYEIAGGLGVKMADPSHEVYIMVGDGSFLMMSSEIVTSIQEGYKLNIILIDNHGYSSIGGLSQSARLGGIRHRLSLSQRRDRPSRRRAAVVDFAGAAQAMGAYTVRARTRQEFEAALETIKTTSRTTLIVIETDKEARVPGYESWWDVAIAEVSAIPAVRDARAEYEQAVKRERALLIPHRS